MSYWRINEEKSQAHWLQLDDAKFDEDECWPQWDAILKWDECCHLNEKNQPGQGKGQYWHLCGLKDIDEMIARLQEMRAIGLAYFNEHQKDYWEDDTP